jgi:hypothetical protein
MLPANSRLLSVIYAGESIGRFRRGRKDPRLLAYSCGTTEMKLNAPRPAANTEARFASLDHFTTSPKDVLYAHVRAI